MGKRSLYEWKSKDVVVTFFSIITFRRLGFILKTSLSSTFWIRNNPLFILKDLKKSRVTCRLFVPTSILSLVSVKVRTFVTKTNFTDPTLPSVYEIPFSSYYLTSPSFGRVKTRVSWYSSSSLCLRPLCVARTKRQRPYGSPFPHKLFNFRCVPRKGGKV